MTQQWKWDPALTNYVPGTNFKDRTGVQYGSLTCLYPTRRVPKHTVWMCRCACGKEVEALANNLQKGTTTTCGCRRSGATNSRWTGYGELSGRYVSNLKAGARKRGIVVELTAKEMWEVFLEQGRKCALSGRLLTFKGTEMTASLDRIDSRRGYVRDNVQWVHKLINTMKMDISQQDFIQMCLRVASQHYMRSHPNKKEVILVVMDHPQTSPHLPANQGHGPTSRGAVASVPEKP